MAKQRHDLGVQKRLKGEQRQEPDKLRWQRVKRRHPGPLPLRLRFFKAWLAAGRPRR